MVVRKGETQEADIVVTNAIGKIRLSASTAMEIYDLITYENVLRDMETTLNRLKFVGDIPQDLELDCSEIAKEFIRDKNVDKYIQKRMETIVYQTYEEQVKKNGETT